MIRLFVNDSLGIGAEIKIIDKQHHYLVNVMRCSVGDDVSLINGRDGEFISKITFINNKYCLLKIISKTKDFVLPKFFGLIFCPIQKNEILLKSSTELGITDFFPCISKYTNKTNAKLNRFESNIIEAVEQSERLDLPKIHKLQTLKDILDTTAKENAIIFFCEERSGFNNPLNIYKKINVEDKKIYALVGAEGGFSKDEKELINSYSNVVSITLGNNILRAETAAIAVLSILKAFYFLN